MLVFRPVMINFFNKNFLRALEKLEARKVVNDFGHLKITFYLVVVPNITRKLFVAGITHVFINSFLLLYY